MNNVLLFGLFRRETSASEQSFLSIFIFETNQNLITMQKLSSEEFFSLLDNPIGKRYLTTVELFKNLYPDLKPEKGFHIHHIHPRSLGGSYKKANLVKVPVFTHFKMHVDLALSTKTNEMFYAAVILSAFHIQELSDLEKVSLENIQEWVDVYQKGLSLCSHLSPTKGKKAVQLDGTIKFIKKEDIPDYIQQGWIVRGKTPFIKGKIKINKDGKNKLILPGELDFYLESGWKKGDCKQTGKKQLFKIEEGEVKHKIVFQRNEAELEDLIKKGWKLGFGPRSNKITVRRKHCRMTLDGNVFRNVPVGKVQEFQEQGYYICKSHHNAGTFKGKKLYHKDGKVKRPMTEEAVQKLLKEGWLPGGSKQEKIKFDSNTLC